MSEVAPAHVEETSPQAAAAPGTTPAATGMRVLQGKVGNAAVARWLAQGRAGARDRRPGSTPATPVLSRYEAGEHAQFGSDEKVLVHGVPISKGNIIAMGDFFRTPEDMNAADPDVLTKLDAAITQDRQARTTGKDADGKPVTAPTNDDIQKITKPLGPGNQYMDLNKENEGHFAPPAGGAAPDGKDHKSQWEKFHRQALDQAHAVAAQVSTERNKSGDAPGEKPATPPPAGSSEAPPPIPLLPKPPQPADPVAPASVAPAEAVVTNMFAAHFLTDAFAAGHLINKGEVVAQAKEKWSQMAESGILLKENTFTQEVSKRVLAHPDVTKKMADMQMIDLRAIGTGAIIGGVIGGVAGGFAGGGWGAAGGAVLGGAIGGLIGYAVAGYDDVTPERLSELLHITSRLDPGTFFNIFARMVHDKLNRDGVEVSNGDETWLLSGDETLKGSEQSLRIGRKAVAESERNIEEAATVPGEINYEAMFQRVWKLVPHPTEKGQKFMDDVREELTNAADPKAVDAAVDLSVHEIDTAIDQMTQMHILRPKPGSAAATSGGPAPGPAAAPPETP